VLRLGALVAVASPVVALAVVFFGGATVGYCHRPVGDSPGSLCPMEVVVGPLIRTDTGIALGLIVSVVCWLVGTLVVVDHLGKLDRSRLVRIGAGILFFAAAAASVGFLNGLTQRLRYAVDGGISWGLAGLVLGWFLAVAWIGIRAGREGRMVDLDLTPVELA
jgi:hypothetical protein